MPHWTIEGSGSSDKVVYAAISEAHSGFADDVGSYLFELRRDLLLRGSWISKLAMFLWVVTNKHTL